ncbi:DEAD/DEAH box helicase [Holophaga foetida]|uniref:DEAD/DEAH box helicase n=1 Tax=Holophaga foetida TaxID=35839 RepID=UPI00024717C4|nr:DEAD/DEAH box helicase [Holophaga foetida]
MSLWLSPRGHLHPGAPEEGLDASLAASLHGDFEVGSGAGLFLLGAREIGSLLPPVLAYWRDFGARYVAALCLRPEGEEAPPRLAPPEDLPSILLTAPPMPGGEYLSVEVLAALWGEMDRAFHALHSASRTSLQDFLKSLNPAWNRVGRVNFNLAENRKDEDHPFAFLATYTGQFSSTGKVQHLPLGQALRDYAGASNKDRLLSLLVPVQRAAERCPWLKRMVDGGEIFHPLRWTPAQAFRFLGDVPHLEHAGVVVRMPATWKAGRPSRPQVSASVGTKAPSAFGLAAMLDFSLALSLDGEELTETEVQELLKATQGLALIRGQWVEVDPERLERTMARFQEAQCLAVKGGLSFAEAMRMLSGAAIGKAEAMEEAADWSRITAGPWLEELLKGLRSPESLAAIDPGPALKGTLRPYQQAGLRWLHLLSSLGLGACLADDMGLGKTIQIIALLLSLKQRGPSLLVAPASLLANWASELERFAPSLAVRIIHPSVLNEGDRPLAKLTLRPPRAPHGVSGPSPTTPSALSATPLKNRPEDLESLDLVITSYGTLLRIPWMSETAWNLAILDEAQAIKNPGAKQTRAVKQLRARARIALTGTPVENRLGDLWSIFDFINPGLLGHAKAFTAYSKDLARRQTYAPLRNLVRPYILRRLKTDKSVISDLPDKTELKAYCGLSRSQAALYQQAVTEMVQRLESAEGMERRGLVLAYLMRFKQICNHSAQWVGGQAWDEKGSGKFARLRELCEEIAERQEKVLVFTQFKEATEPLAAFLAGVFGRKGLVLHGETEVKKRKDLVARFQEDETVPFFVLSIKAGGSGLNLTAASHVIHFDRWWNPSVENQATDRAFRIGQTRNVLVHKFICRGTVEEKIDALIESKRQLSQELLEGGAELNLTEMRDDELLRLVSLDLNAALEG